MCGSRAIARSFAWKAGTHTAEKLPSRIRSRISPSRTFSCATISGIDSGITTGAGAGATVIAVSLASAFTGAGAGFVVRVRAVDALFAEARVAGAMTGSFVTAANVKSKRYSGASGLSFIFAVIDAGNATPVTRASRYALSRDGCSRNDVMSVEIGRAHV